jgi:hypothetical protein
MMLRRLCRCRDIAPLEVLLGTIEPVKVYRRGQQRKHTQFSPLTRMVDAAWPDAAPARQFRWAVARLLDNDLADEFDIASIRGALESWQKNGAALEKALRTSPALPDIETISAALTEVSTFGLEALDHLTESDAAPGAEWLRPRIERLEAAREPHGQTELMVVDAVLELVCAAALPASLTESGCQPKQEAMAEGEH